MLHFPPAIEKHAAELLAMATHQDVSREALQSKSMQLNSRLALATHQAVSCEAGMHSVFSTKKTNSVA